MSDARTIEDRAEDQKIRAWASSKGLDVKARGRIPDGVKIAYRAAAGAAPPPAAGPDEDDLAEDAGTGQLEDDLAPEPIAAENWQRDGDSLTFIRQSDGTRMTLGSLDDLEQLAQGPPAAPDAGGEQEPPPPADMAEARARLGRTPRARGWTGGKGEPNKSTAAPRPKSPPPSKVPASVVKDVEGKLVLLLALPAVSAKRIDPVCGKAFADNVEDMARAWAPLICQSADMVKLFTSATLFMLWLTALQSMVPVAEAVYDHHFAPGRKDPRAQGQQPGVRVPDEDLSMYVVPGHIPQPQAG